MTVEIHADAGTAAVARQALLDWYDVGVRAFPWRGDSNPYHVLMAEMMLRRTQARQVVPVYTRFLARFPDVVSLDRASSEEVVALLRPLGLDWRAANFKHLTRAIMAQFDGQVPRDRAALLALPGVGPYVADAVRCFAFAEPATLVDTNTVRVAARFFGFGYDAESRRRPAVIQAVTSLVAPTMAARSNYALLDFAATICRARDPVHTACPLAGACIFYRQVLQTDVPQAGTGVATAPGADAGRKRRKERGS